MNDSSTSPPTNIIDHSKGRSNRDEEAEAQRKHRSSLARRERRSTQSVTVEDIKAAEEQIANRSNKSSTNPIGAPSTPSLEIESSRFQQLIEQNKDQGRKTNAVKNTFYSLQLI